MRFIHFLAPIAAASLLFACGSDDEEEHEEEETLEEHMCEHFEGGPFEDLTAGTSLDDAPTIAIPHTPVHLTLPADGEMFTGVGQFQVAEEGNVVIALGSDVTAAVADAAGTAQTPEGNFTSTGVCSSLVRWDMYHLPVGTYSATFSTDAEMVTVLVGFPAGDDDHDHEEE